MTLVTLELQLGETEPDDRGGTQTGVILWRITVCAFQVRPTGDSSLKGSHIKMLRVKLTCRWLRSCCCVYFACVYDCVRLWGVEYRKFIWWVEGIVEFRIGVCMLELEEYEFGNIVELSMIWRLGLWLRIRLRSLLSYRLDRVCWFVRSGIWKC